MRDLLDRMNAERPRMGFISYADAFLINADENEANNLRAETSRNLSDIGLVIDQTKSVLYATVKERMESRDPLLQGQHCRRGHRNK